MLGNSPGMLFSDIKRG